MGKILDRFASNDFLWKVYNRLIGQPAARFKQARMSVLRERVLNRFSVPATVAAGPFKGLIYPELQSQGGALPPKLLGTYESELHPILNKWKQHDFNRIIDVGAAEGYYAVGLARSYPAARISAFDTSQEGRELCKQMAEINGTLDRTEIHRICTRRTLLEEDFSDGGLIICDCEGYEGELFDQDVATQLKNCHLIIELHDSPSESIEIRSRLLPLFNGSHSVSLITSYTDSYKAHNYECNNIGTDPIERFVALAEKRPWQMDWLVCEPESLDERYS